MGDDSCTRGCGFRSRHRILDGYFSHSFVVKNVPSVCFKIPKINEKEAKINYAKILCRVGPKGGTYY